MSKMQPFETPRQSMSPQLISRKNYDTKGVAVTTFSQSELHRLISHVVAQFGGKAPRTPQVIFV